MVKDQERVALLQINFKEDKSKLTDDEVLWAGLNALEAVGGLVLRPGFLVLNDISSLLRFEAAVHWVRGDKYPDLVLAHSAARVLDGVRELPSHHSMSEALALLNSTEIVKRYPLIDQCSVHRCRLLCSGSLTMQGKSMQ